MQTDFALRASVDRNPWQLNVFASVERCMVPELALVAIPAIAAGVVDALRPCGIDFLGKLSGKLHNLKYEGRSHTSKQFRKTELARGG